jgi:GNAT superfamily N-acetyltransferase
MTPGDVRIRHIEARDWDGIEALESGAYTPLGLSEGRAALQSRVRASPDTCFALDLGCRLVGYLLALPYPAAASPDLVRAESTVFRSRNLHLHDLVLADDVRGRGLGRRLVRHLDAVAASRGYERVSLVAVGGTETFWSAAGFVADESVVPSAGYGPSAVYMSRAVVADPAGPAAPAGVAPRGAPRDEVG